MKNIIVGLMLLPILSYAGNSVGNGGDWFIRTLPLLKIKFPTDGTSIMGVTYSKVGLRKCNQDEENQAAQNLDHVTSTYLPDENWKAIKVLIYNGKDLICSFGLKENDPGKALKLLVDNEDTNRTLYADFPNKPHVIEYSRSYGQFRSFPYTIGTYLITADPKIPFDYYNPNFVGFNLQEMARPLGKLKTLNTFNTNQATDWVYIPTNMETNRKYSYFMQTVTDSLFPAWRIVIPLAYSQQDLPLKDIAEKVAQSRNYMGPISFDPFIPLDITKIVVWSSGNMTPTSKKLREALRREYGFSKSAVYQNPLELLPKFKLTLLPTIENSALNHSAFQHGNLSSEITMPIVNQYWRTGADVVHELTHILQKSYGSNSSADEKFHNEMEAHLNERQHIFELSQIYSVVGVAAPIFNYLVAASLPQVEWSEQWVSPQQSKLCDDVIAAYKIDKSKVKPETLKKYGCD